MTTPVFDTSEGVALITDGSCNYQNRSGGWAFVAVDAFEGLYTESGHQKDTTISQMELIAPIRGLDWVNDEFGPCEVLIYSDSEYVVKGVNDRTRKRNKNKGHWRLLDSVIDKHISVDFIHIKGHNDHLYNEMADQLAGAARKEGISGTHNRSK